VVVASDLAISSLSGIGKRFRERSAVRADLTEGSRASSIRLVSAPLSPPGRAVLVVDDDIAFAQVVADLLRENGFTPDVAHDHAQATDRVSHSEYAVAIVDLVMPGGGGLELADNIRAKNADTQILILTGHGSLPSAIAGIRRGVFDYLQKADLDLQRLAVAVGSAAEQWRLRRENRLLLARLQQGNQRLQSLHEATARLAGADHGDRVLEVLVESARGLLRVERARVLLFEHGHDGTIMIRDAAGDGASVLKGVRLQPGEGLAAHVALRNDFVLLGRAETDPRYSPRCDDLGASGPGFVCVPLRHATLRGVLSAAGREGSLGEEDRQVAFSLATQAATALDNAVKNERAINFFTHTCNILVSFLETKDVHLPGHSRAVAALADMLTRRLGLKDDERRDIHFAALLHDIGKVLLEPELLREGQRLDHDQVLRMREHAALGVELLKPITLWEAMLPLIQTHHERFDGTGYPSGLAGEDIPLGARVIAVADAFDAMTRGYPGRPPRTPEQAIAELQAGAGSQFDPRLVRLFAAEYPERAPRIP
jgi:putative nucleotidyltransferase with HDIG domain